MIQHNDFDPVIFSSPGRSPGRAIVLLPALASTIAKCLSFYVKVFYVMGKALSLASFSVPVTGFVIIRAEAEIFFCSAVHLLELCKSLLILVQMTGE